MCFFQFAILRTKEKKRARLRTTKTTTCPNCLSSSAFLSLPSVGFSSLSLSLFYARVRQFFVSKRFFLFFLCLLSSAFFAICVF